MAADSSRSIKIIAFMGLLVFAFLWLSSLGLKKSIQPDESQRVKERAAQSPVDGQRALALTSDIAALGPRPAGSESLRRAADLVADAARTSGARVEINTTAPLPHVVARRDGAMPGTLLVLARLDSGPDGPAANERASGAALAVELLRAQASQRRMHGLAVAWLMGEGRGLQPLLQQHHPKAIFVLGPLGDCYLKLGTDPAAPQWLRNMLYDTADRLACTPHFPGQGLPVPDSLGLHTWHPATLYLSDALYGTIATHKQRMGTADDTTAHLCAMSLQAAGDVLYHLVAACDSYLTQLP
jgi:hypothetical protein